jgi:chemotaxis protein MotC
VKRSAKWPHCVVVACLCQGVAFGQPAERRPNEERGIQPVEIMRSLEATQDQVATGSAEAPRQLPRLVAQIAERLLAADAGLWREARNDRAVVIYTLSGGQPRVIRKIIQLGVAPEPEATLMVGALAYVEGQDAKARQILMTIDARALAPSLGGYIALAQSALAAKDDPRRAMRLLDEARILAAGTLVEEAALRRTVFLADETSDLSRFATSSSQYLRRYQRSVYAENFRRRFGESVTRFGITGDPGQREKLRNLLSELEASEQLNLYLNIAQYGILKGKIEPARFAAAAAMRLSQETGLEQTRSKLYQATTTILTQSLEVGLRELAEVDASHLQKRDQELSEVVAKMAGQIQKETEAGQVSANFETSDARSLPQDKDGEDAPPSDLIDSARVALSQTEALLKRASP